MGLFRPYTTLLVGVALGLFVVPKVAAKVGVSVPGM
jgi:hypothetical protein